ncbi:MAG: NAD(P)-dependent oxidoreductase [Pseudomonadota bacterium]
MNATSGKIGFVGIGTMGTPMATNLTKAGYKVLAYEIDPKRAAALAATREIEIAASLIEVGEKCATVITMLPEGKHVREAVCGKGDSFSDCIAAGLKPGSLLIDMSSSSPLGTRELGALLENRGIKLIDAPVSNGLKGAIAATLSIMVGGDQALFEQCRPLFEKMGNQIFYAGPLGAGHAIKALNNYVSAAGLVAACEAVIAAQRFGLDPNVAVDILNASSGMNNTTKNKVKQHMLSGTFGAGFITGLMAKDVRTALEVAQAMQVPTLLAQPCTEIWNRMEKKLGAASDHTEMFRYLESVSKNEKQ